jgi:hypothetical protein
MDPAAKRRFDVVWYVGKEFLTSGPVAEPPLLGPAYRAKVDRLRGAVREQSEALLAELRPMSEDELFSNFDEDGAPKTDEARAIVRRHFQQTRAIGTRGGPWLFPALFPRAGMADYGHWAKAAHLAIDEATFLSLGLDPRGLDMDGKDQWPIRSDGSESRAVADRKDLFQRKFHRVLHSNRLKFPDILAWIDEVGLEVHSGFRQILEARSEALRGSVTGDLAEDVPQVARNDDPRERASLMKLVIVMAISGYRYDPQALRSKTVAEIQNDAELLGITLSQDTIRKYLREAAKELPDDWRSDQD